MGSIIDVTGTVLGGMSQVQAACILSLSVGEKQISTLLHNRLMASKLACKGFE